MRILKSSLILFYLTILGFTFLSCQNNDDTDLQIDTLYVIDSIQVIDTIYVYSTVIPGAGVTDVDGNFYKSTIILDQEWMSENLRTTKYKDGSTIQLAEDNNTWSSGETGYWSFYDNNSGLNSPYGKLYNWYAIADSRGICPQGWRVPSAADWQKLVDHLGGENIAGASLKEKGTAHWRYPNAGANNLTGFSGLPGGGRGSSGEFVSFQVFGRYWTGTAVDAFNAYGRDLLYDQTWFNESQYNKHFGFCIRCIKD